MKLLKFAALAFLVLTLSCNNQASEEVEQLYNELVTGHDEVMPKSMAIPSIREKMMKASETASEEKKAEALDISTQLLKSEDRMNEWMMEFGDAINGDPALKLDKYRKLHEEIVLLKSQTDEAIENAKKLTAELEVQ